MSGSGRSVVQLVVQLGASHGRRHTLRRSTAQLVSPRWWEDHRPVSGDPRTVASALTEGMTEPTSTDIRTIAERIHQHLSSMAEQEQAIRVDLETPASLAPAKTDDRLLDIAAAAAWLGVSRATMFRLIRSDPHLRHVKLGKRTLFRPEDLRTYAALLVAS